METETKAEKSICPSPFQLGSTVEIETTTTHNASKDGDDLTDVSIKILKLQSSSNVKYR